MHNTTNRPPLDIIKWGDRLLYVLLVIFMTVSMFYWNYPTTLPYLGAILSLFYLNRIWARHSESETRVNVHKCTLEYK